MTEQDHPSEYLFHEIYYKSHGFRLRVNAQKVDQEKGWITYNIIKTHSGNQIVFNNGEKYDLFDDSQNIWILKDNVYQGNLIDKIKELNAIKEIQNNNSEEYELVFTLLNYEQKQNYIGSLTNQRIIEVTNKYDTYDTVFEFVKENAAKAFIPNHSFAISKRNEDNYFIKITIEITNRQKKQIRFDLDVNLEQIKTNPARLKREIKLAEGHLLVQKLQQLQQQEQEQQYEPNAISSKLLQQILNEYEEAQNNHEKIVTNQKINDSQIYQPQKGDSILDKTSTTSTLNDQLYNQQSNSRTMQQPDYLLQQNNQPKYQTYQINQQNQFSPDIISRMQTQIQQIQEQQQISQFNQSQTQQWQQQNLQRLKQTNQIQLNQFKYLTNDCFVTDNFAQGSAEFQVKFVDEDCEIQLGILEDGLMEHLDKKVRAYFVKFPSGQLIRGAEDPIQFMPRPILPNDEVVLKILPGLFKVCLNGTDIPPIKIKTDFKFAFAIKCSGKVEEIISQEGNEDQPY